MMSVVQSEPTWMVLQRVQRERALQQANLIRTTRRLMREAVKHGELDVVELLLEPPATLLTAKIGAVVQWAPRIGEWRVKRILNGLARPNAPIGLLGDPTRRRIAARLAFYLNEQG